ncbi:MAG: hypothetical protein WCQ44_10515, partial [Opitutaceae bacterium]
MLLNNLFEELARTGKGKAAVVGWGRGMGHKGHMFLASSVITQARESNADPYFVVSRNVGKDDPINPEEKLAIYKKVFPQSGHIFQTATEEMPDLTRVLTKLQGLGYSDVTVVVGADQVNALGYVKNYNGKPNKSGDIPFTFNTLNVISRQETSDPSRDQEGPRATPMRAVLMDPSKSEEEKFAVWRDAMNPELSDEEVMDLMHKAQQRMQAMVKPKKGVAEGYRRVAGLLTDIANPQNPMVKDPDTYNELPAAEYFKSHPEFDQQTWQQEVQKNIQAIALTKQRQQQGLVVNPLTGEQQLQSEVDAQRKELERILSPEEQQQFISLSKDPIAKGRFLKQVWAKKADQKQFASLLKVHWTGGVESRDKLEQILSGKVSSKAELSARMYKNQEEIPGNKPGWGTDTIGLVLDGWTTIAGFQDLRSDNQKIGKGSANRSQQKYT